MKIELQAIAFVKNERAMVEDDNWASVISEIELASHIITAAFDGIEAFSHLEIIFYMNAVKDEKAKAQSRHPRNNKSLPEIGTFAQRNKNRPNKLGLTTVELVKRDGRKLLVKRLDAINGTPILDIKPVLKAFEPEGEIREPNWVNIIMEKYW